jgi:hypothetical protein
LPFVIFGKWGYDMNNSILACISVSILLIISLSPYHGPFSPYQAFGQNSTMEIGMVKALVDDSIQSLNNKDLNGALEHLKLVDYHLGQSGNSSLVLTSRTFVQDAIQAVMN